MSDTDFLSARLDEIISSNYLWKTGINFNKLVSLLFYLYPNIAKLWKMPKNFVFLEFFYIFVRKK